MIESSIRVCCASAPVCSPIDMAFTFVDYEQDWDGVAENLTWSQLYRRVAKRCPGAQAVRVTGDRAVILAPQGLDYIIGFLGALQAGLIAVPLSVPLGGATTSASVR